MDNIKNELLQRIEDLKIFTDSLNSHSESVEMFIKEMKISAEHVGIASSLIQELVNEVLEKFDEIPNKLSEKMAEYEEKYNQILQILETPEPLGERVLYCEDQIKFIMQLLSDKEMLPGQVNENKMIILNNLPSGKYVLKYENEDGTETIIDTTIIK